MEAANWEDSSWSLRNHLIIKEEPSPTSLCGLCPSSVLVSGGVSLEICCPKPKLKTTDRPLRPSSNKTCRFLYSHTGANEILLFFQDEPRKTHPGIKPSGHGVFQVGSHEQAPRTATAKDRADEGHPPGHYCPFYSIRFVVQEIQMENHKGTATGGKSQRDKRQTFQQENVAS